LQAGQPTPSSTSTREGCRDMANEDSDFDPIRDEAAFLELIGR
jgi:hypothetical protein